MSKCFHSEWDTLTGPEKDPRLGKLICVDCGMPQDEAINEGSYCAHEYHEVSNETGVKCIKCGHFVGNWE